MTPRAEHSVMDLTNRPKLKHGNDIWQYWHAAREFKTWQQMKIQERTLAMVSWTCLILHVGSDSLETLTYGSAT